MKPFQVALVVVALALSSAAQGPLPQAITAPMLNFEMPQPGVMPVGWGGTPGTIFVDKDVVHAGQWAVRIERNATSPNEFSTLTKGIVIDFGGDRIEWRGFLRTENVSNYVGLWMREDGDSPGLAFDNMQQRQIKGTRDWTEYSINLPVHPEAKSLTFGVLLSGTGKVWIDDLQLLVDGKPVWEDAASYINRARGTKGLVIDIRNYPSEFMVFPLGTLLVDRPTPFAHFTAPDIENPGATLWENTPVTLMPQQPRYAGKVVILVDEISQSQAEYTTMAFRSAPGAIVVGSTTAGADGNVSQITLPGGLSTMISGLGVFYPDKKPTQRIGILPDIEARPTIAGVRAGRDEVLEVALRQILGPQTAADQIEKMARP